MQGVAQPQDSKRPADQCIEGDQPFQAKNALALVEKFRSLAGLALEALFEMRRAQPRTELAGLFGGQRMTRPSWPVFSPGLGT
mgnify:FL=1